jgi:hypothetical protein
VAPKRRATSADLDAKREFLRDYFQERQRQLHRAKQLIRQREYLFEGILVLCCHIASYAALRFPRLRRDRDAFKKIVFKYSNKRAFYEKIDLFFLYQWPGSAFKNHGDYKGFRNYREVKRILVSKFGDENRIQNGRRYVAQSTIMKHIISNPFHGFDRDNLKRSLPLFSLSEELYRYLRSFAVHNFRFPFLNRVNGEYVANHVITPDVLSETAQNILSNLETECVKKAKFPEQLRQQQK